MNKHNILLITPFIYPYHAGGGLNALSFGKFLEANGYKTKILSFNRNFKHQTNSVIEGLRILRIPYLNKTLVLKIFSLPIILTFYLCEIIRSDIIIIYGGHIIAWETIPIFGKIINKRVIFRSTMFGEDDIETLLNCNKVLHILRKLSLISIQNYFSLTPKFTKSFFKIFPNSEKIVETPQGVNDKVFYPIDKQKKLEIRKKLDLPNDELIIISVGQLINRKGYLKIIPELTKLDIPFKYIILGDYDLSQQGVMKEYENQANDIFNIGNTHLSEKILFKGFVSNVNEYLQASDIFLLGSRKEGLPNALLEAMAVGLPIVFKNINGITGYLIEHFHSGIVYEDYNQIIYFIKLLYNNPSLNEKLGTNAHNKINSGNTFEAILNKLELSN